MIAGKPCWEATAGARDVVDVPAGQCAVTFSGLITRFAGMHVLGATPCTFINPHLR